MGAFHAGVVTGVDHRRLAGFSDLRVAPHHLGAASNNQIFHARHYLRRRELVVMPEPQKRSSVTIRGYVAPALARVTEVARLLTRLSRGAPDNVVDLGSVQIIPLGQCGEDGRA